MAAVGMLDSPLPPAIVVAGVSSGVGKTSMAIGLMVALRRQGLRVQPFKVGPDFLDPMHHTVVCGTPSVNLDGWMLGQEGCQTSFARACKASNADVAVIEGVMGLYDGLDGKSEAGSTAEVAKWLQAPVVLVLDAWCLSRSAAAMVFGYTGFDPDVPVCGVIFNRVAGDSHAAWLKEAMSHASVVSHITVLGCVPKSKDVEIQERHLGLERPTEIAFCYEQLGSLFNSHVDISKIFPSSRLIRPTASPSSNPDTPNQPCDSFVPRVRIGIARDEAFCFYYDENLQLLQAAGAELVPFSPLADTALPSDLSALYFGGGYPELYGARLEQNKEFRRSVKSFCEDGGFCWAECGGLMYLSQSMGVRPKDDPSAPAGRRFAMVGVLPFEVDMTDRMVMGYCLAKLTPALAALLRLPQNTEMRCQQYHLSEIRIAGEPAEVVDNLGRSLGIQGVELPAYEVRFERPGASFSPEGVLCGDTVASYCHVHFGATPGLAQAFVAAARRKLTVASLAPNGTEALCAIPGGRDRLVAISAHCDYPPSVLSLRRASLNLVQVEGRNSEDVESQVQQLLASGVTDFHPLDVEWFSNGRPGLVLTQDSCPTCDADVSSVGKALGVAGLGTERAMGVGANTISTILDAIVRIGDAIGEGPTALAVRHRLQGRLVRVKDIVSNVARKPRVLGLESVFPLVASGQWLPDMRLHAGAVDALGDTPGAAPRRLSWNDVVACAPEIIIISCCGRTAAEAAADVSRHLFTQPEFASLPAVRARPPRLYCVGHSLFSRPGPRVIDGVEQLAALIHPSCFPRSAARDALCLYLEIGEELPLMMDQETAKRWMPVHPAWDPDIHSCTDHDSKWCTVWCQNSPSPRAAHVVVSPGHSDELFVIAGEMPPEDEGSCKRGADVWRATMASDVATWHHQDCSAVSGENVPTARSNHCGALWGDVLIIFGGWSADGSAPLAKLELLHLKSLCWTHGSSTGTPPSPRGNPNLVVNNSRGCAVVFGGWDGVKRFSDVHTLDLNTWHWERVDCGDGPCPRSDHAACVWEGQGMLVHGGSSVDGLLDDLWLLRWEGPVSTWRWENLSDLKNAPQKRSSHAVAMMAGALIVIGGQCDSKVLKDVHALMLRTQHWVSLPCLPRGVCRHGAAVVKSGIAIWGGYDGRSHVDSFLVLPHHVAWRVVSAGVVGPMRELHCSQNAAVDAIQIVWDSSKPLSLEDVKANASGGDDGATKALAAIARLSPEKQAAATWAMLHRTATAQLKDQYVDPATGYSVFTSRYLKKRQCCGFKCRHCPHGHVNVPNCGQAELANDW